MLVSILFILTITEIHVDLLENVSMVELFLPGSTNNILSNLIFRNYLCVADGSGASAFPSPELAKKITRQAAPPRALIWSELYWPGHNVPSCNRLAAETSIITR